ncbi:MAG TPA: phage GP46 family protein [Caulobacteraceae bacterium]|nr:phage GP46 family protein [Caulobacteraceae bacterium]
MSDIALNAVFADVPFDIALAGADLQMDDGMKTAVIISLFTDKRAPDDVALPDNSGDRRGWWSDAYAEIPGDQIGSLLWTLGRSKQTTDVLTKAQGYAQDALQWLVDDGAASAVAVVTSYPRRGWMNIAVTIARPSGTSRYDFMWRMM